MVQCREEITRVYLHGTCSPSYGPGNYVLLSLVKLPEGLDLFLYIFNACFESGTLPDPWRVSEIFILFKGKGNVLDPNSYHGIALLDSCFKLHERLLYHWLKTWAFANELILHSQFGFRPRQEPLLPCLLSSPLFVSM